MKRLSLLLMLSLGSSRLKMVSGQDGTCSTASPCPDTTHCCSQFGWCGSGDAYCGSGCQAGPCDGGTPPTPPPSPGNYNYCGTSWTNAYNTCGASCYGGQDSECPASTFCFADVDICPLVTGPGGPTTPPPGPSPTPLPTPASTPPAGGPPTGPTPVAEGDSRVIAYVANWQDCPTSNMIDGYTHMVIAFAVTYSWAQSKNNCNAQCEITPTPVCVGATSTTVSDWRAQNKKVILSFGGAGMGGSWTGDPNNCWDYCFEKEDTLSTALVNMVDDMGLDGIDLDYEYCYDVGGIQSGRCTQRSNLYTDEKARTFLSEMTSQLRQKMDALSAQTGVDYELTHAPMDSDLVPSSPYYQILKARNQDLNFLMPQFYNGITRPVLDGFDGSGQGQVPTSQVYNNIANDIFPGQPGKVVMGFCLQSCVNTATSSEAVTVLQEVKAYNGGEYLCNGGAFFWVASMDAGGSWSDPVYAEVSKTTGCSNSGTSGSPTTSPTPGLTPGPSRSPSKSPVPQFPGQCSDGTGACSAEDLGQCACAGRRSLLKGGASGGERKRNLRKLGKKTSPTQPPVQPPPTNPPMNDPSKNPTQSPTQSPTSFQCMCLLPTPEPTPVPTPPLTPQPTPPSGGCPCDNTQKNTCEAACGGNVCSWIGKTKTCVLVV